MASKRDLACTCHVVVCGFNVVEEIIGGVLLDAVRKSHDDAEEVVGDEDE